MGQGGGGRQRQGSGRISFSCSKQTVQGKQRPATVDLAKGGAPAWVEEVDAKAGGMGDMDPGGGGRRGTVLCRIKAEAAPWLLLKPEEKKVREGIQRGSREGKLGATAG